MKLATLMTTFSGLCIVAAIPTGPPPPQGPKVHLSWNPERAFETLPWIKKLWEERCHAALARAGCNVGIIHPGLRTMSEPLGDGGKTYVYVEGAPLIDMENSKKLRVFDDGSSRDGWAPRDYKWLGDAPTSGKRKRKGPSAQGRNTLLYWDPPDAYVSQPRKKSYWEEKCKQVLAKEGCGFGIIHKGEVTSTKPNGEKISYVTVEGAPSMGVQPLRKMRVFQDGRSENVDDWSRREQKTMTGAKRARRDRMAKQRQGDLRRPSGTVLHWDPVHAYQGFPHKRSYWEERCHQALAKENCHLGIIHQGETKVTKPTGETTSYVNVQGVFSTATDPNATKQLRVFRDESAELGWSERDRWLMQQAKRPRRSQRARHAAVIGRFRASTSARAPIQEHTQDTSKHRISWDPPHAYEYGSFFRKSYEEACHNALEREGCNSAVILQGYHRLKNAVAADLRTRYMNVSMGKQGDPHNMRYARLFEDGSSEWYPPGPLPERKRVKPPGKKVQAQIRTSHGESPWTNGEISSAQGQGASEPPRKRRKKQDSTSAQPEGASATTQAPTLAAYPGRLQVPGGGEYQSSASQAHTQEPTQVESPGHFQVPGEGGLDLNLPPAQAPAQAESRVRPHAPGRRGGGGLDLNFPPTLDS